MLTKQRAGAIFALALPIIGGMVSQNVLNLVDTWMVGQLGDAALLAVSQASFANFVMISLITGLSAGVQAMAARRMGEERPGEAAVPLNGGLLIAFLVSIPLMVAAFVFADDIFPILSDDPKVIEQGVPYWNARAASMFAVGMNFSFRGYWNAVHMSRLYMRTLIFMHVTNVALSYCLIFGHLGLPALGTMGAGLGTSISVILGTGYYFVLGFKHARVNGFLAGLPTRETIGTIVRIAVPSCIQTFLFAMGMTVFMKIAELLGTSEGAATAVLINLILVAVLPGIAFGLAASTFVGETLGKQDPDGARTWGWDVAKLGALTVGAFTIIPAVLFPRLLLSPFLTNPETLELAVLPLQISAIAMPIDTLGLVLLNAHLGAGASRRAMLVSVFMQWGIGLPAAWFLGPELGLGVLGVFLAQSGYRGLQSLVFALSWRGDSWTRIEV